MSEPTCPECGGPVDSMPTCHTWGGKADGTGWKACLPCDSATEWYCEGTEANDYRGCGWHWTDGLNPRNPRSVANEAKRPAWATTK